MSFQNWLKTGNIVDTDFCYHELPDKLDIYDHDAFLRNKTPFFVVCSNVETGQPEYMRVTDMREQIDCLRASASLPYFSRIVEINGKKYLDGGATDSIPVDAFMRMGYQRNVVILTRDATYKKSPELRMLPGLVYRRYPAFANTLQNRHIVYNKTVKRIAELEKQGIAFVIRPSEPMNVGRMEKNPEQIQRAYETGYADAGQRMETMLAWLSRQ